MIAVYAPGNLRPTSAVALWMLVTRMGKELKGTWLVLSVGLAMCAGLAGCVSRDSRILSDTPTDASWAGRKGLAHIQGHISRGEVYGAGEPVWLIPSVKATDVWLTGQLQESGNDFSSLDFHELDESLRPFVKASIADSQGRFRFDDLPGGTWTVVGCMRAQVSSTSLPERVCMHTQATVSEAGETTVSLTE